MRAAATIALILSAGLFAGVSGQVKSVSALTHFRTIKVVSQPAASVWIDGVLFGRTDKNGVLEIKTISAVGHSIRVRADSFKEKTTTLTAVQKGEIRVSLVKTTDSAELAFQEGERLLTADRDKAADAYRRAIKLRPKYPEAYVALSRVLSETGDLDEAEKAALAARKLRPAYAEASAVEGRIHKDNGQEPLAIAAFKRAITEGKGFQPEALTGLGLLYKEKAEGFGGSGDFEQEKANYDESAKYLRSAVKQLSGAPDSLVVYQLLGLVYERQKKYRDAIALYEEFLLIFPNSAEASAVRSFIEQLKKQMNDEN
jgi:tetratricopeptide (TPR) repeat protein